MSTVPQPGGLNRGGDPSVEATATAAAAVSQVGL